MQAQSTTTAQCIGFLFFGSSKNNSIYETLQQVRECICVCACVWKAFNSVPIKVTYQSMVHNALQKKGKNSLHNSQQSYTMTLMSCLSRISIQKAPF